VAQAGVPGGGVLSYRQRVEFTGHGVNPDRQEKPHVHSVVFSPDHHFLYVQDLGLDRITTLHFSAEVELEKQQAAARAMVSGAGPRHLVLGPMGILLI